MPTALESREVRLLVHETLIVLFLQSLVPLEDVEWAVVVLGVVGAFAAAPDCVEHFQLLQLVVAQVVEQKLGTEVSVGITEVLEADDVLVLDAPRVLGMPPHTSVIAKNRSQNLIENFCFYNFIENFKIELFLRNLPTL